MPVLPLRLPVLGRRFIQLAALILTLTVPAIALAQTTLRVEGPDALASALSSAPEGSVLLLAGGDYGALRIRGDIGAAVIRSADPARPARFTSADVQEVTGISFENLLFDYRFTAGDREADRPFAWRGNRNLTLRNNLFEGDAARGVSGTANGYGFTIAATVWNSRDVLIEGNEIRNFFKGLHVRNVEDLTVRGNDVHDIRSDGMNFVQVAHVVIEGNHIHNFNRSLDSGDHADMIQFWTRGTDWPSHDIVIRGNVLNAGNGWFSQSIFMRNERSDRTSPRDPALFYRNITIEENVIINAHLHGVFVGDANGVRVARNTVVQNPGATPGDASAGRYTPAIRIAEINRNVTVTDNIVSRVLGYEGQAGWQISGNLELAPAQYARVFTGGNPAELTSFRYHSNAQTGRAGAAMLR